MNNWLTLFLATLVGGSLGLFLAYAINTILVSVSINAFFNVYYGILFLVLGTLLLARINQKNKIDAS
jgi:undecaprenyl pyrophosphate phosphatase UppP